MTHHIFTKLKLSVAVVLAATVSTAYAQVYTVKNSCPSPIDWFIDGTPQGTLATGATAVKTGLGRNAGYFYSNTGSGGTINSQITTTRAGFFLEPPLSEYFILRDPNPNNFNMGLSITPDVPATNGFCTTALCALGNCTTAFTLPPKNNSPVPPPADSPAPPPPLYQCKDTNANYLVTFCPTGAWPEAPGAPLKPNFSQNKCIDVRGGVFENGTPVQIYDCNGSNAQQWVFQSGSTQVRVAGTNFCLDAGSNPANGVQMKIWQCFDNLPAQKWVYSNNRITLENQGLCLDLPSGNLANANVLQTWQCTDNNSNQVWTL